jgi:hypothetical protein
MELVHGGAVILDKPLYISKCHIFVQDSLDLSLILFDLPGGCHFIKVRVLLLLLEVTCTYTLRTKEDTILEKKSYYYS